MTEFWVSQARHFCKICKVWTGGHKSQILKHETGRGHIEQEQLYLKEMREREKQRKADQKGVDNELAEIERKAAIAMGMAPPTRVAAVPIADAVKDAQKREIEEAVAAATKRMRTGGHGAAPAAATAAAAPVAAPARVAPVVRLAPSLLVDAVCPWTKHQDPNSGSFYYYNRTTGVSSWTQPPDFWEPGSQPPAIASAASTASSSASAAAAAQAAVAAPGRPGVAAPDAASVAAAAAAGSSAQMQPAGDDWVVCTDPGSGSLYYFNKQTLVSTWEKPAELQLDLAAPPPPPSAKKPPPPPARKGDGADREKAPVVGGWEEVKPEESMFGRPDEVEATAAMIEEEEEAEAAIAPALREIRNLKETTEKRRFAEEDMELREKEIFQKKSLQTTKGTSFPIARKKASGIRKRGGDDD